MGPPPTHDFIVLCDWKSWIILHLESQRTMCLLSPRSWKPQNKGTNDSVLAWSQRPGNSLEAYSESPKLTSWSLESLGNGSDKEQVVKKYGAWSRWLTSSSFLVPLRFPVYLTVQFILTVVLAPPGAVVHTCFLWKHPLRHLEVWFISPRNHSIRFSLYYSQERLSRGVVCCLYLV